MVHHDYLIGLNCIILYCTVIRLEFGQLDYRVKEGTNNNELCVVVKTVENQNVILASELQLKITPLTFQQQEAMGIPLPPDFPPKPVAASGMFFSPCTHTYFKKKNTFPSINMCRYQLNVYCSELHNWTSGLQ